MKKFCLVLACIACLMAGPSLKAASFSFNVLFDATALLCRPCCPPPRIVERHVYVTPPPIPYYPHTVIREYHPYGCCEERVIVHRPCYIPY